MGHASFGVWEDAALITQAACTQTVAATPTTEVRNYKHEKRACCHIVLQGKNEYLMRDLNRVSLATIECDEPQFCGMGTDCSDCNNCGSGHRRMGTFETAMTNTTNHKVANMLSTQR
jgi:hypothetical protein